MREDVSIRGAVSAEAQDVPDSLASAFEPYRDEYTPEAFRDTVLTAETIGRRLAEMSVFVVVDEGGRIIGTIGYQLIDGEEGHICGMAVLPAHQGRGVARQLLEHVEEELRRRGCARISLDTTVFFAMPLFEYVKKLKRSQVQARPRAVVPAYGSDGTRFFART